jgi:hypothetical protein
VKTNIKNAQPGQVLTYTNPLLSLGVRLCACSPMDYKQPSFGSTMNDLFNRLGPSPYQDFGNFNFGAVGAAWGYPLDLLQRAAGAVQQRAGTSKPEFGSPLGGPPYGDDPADQQQIQAGYEYYKNGCYKNQ